MDTAKDKKRLDDLYDSGSPPWFDPEDLGSNVYSYKPGEMVIAIDGGFNIAAGTAATGIFRTNTYQLNDDLARQVAAQFVPTLSQHTLSLSLPERPALVEGEAERS